MHINVDWDGPTVPGVAPSLFKVELDPLTMAQLVMILESPEVIQQATLFPRAYEGITRLRLAAQNLLDAGQLAELAVSKRYAQAVMSGEVDAGQPLDIKPQPPVELRESSRGLTYAPGRARVPRATPVYFPERMNGMAGGAGIVLGDA